MANQSADSLTIQDLYAKSHAIVIGISEYLEENLRLKNPINDAKEMAKILEEKYGFDSVKLILDRDATKQKLAEIFDDYIRSDDITDKDRLLVYYSGHGDIRQSEDQQGNSFEESYLVPCDAKPKMYSSYLNMEDITENCIHCKAKHVLLILDSCYSGTAFLVAKDVEEKPKKITDEYLKRIINKRTIQAVAATDKIQVALDSSSLTSNHGAFTGCLLDILNRDTDPDNDGILTATEVGLYLEKNVPRSKIPQNPIFGHLPGSEVGEFIFNVFNVSKPKLASGGFLDSETLQILLEEDKRGREVVRLGESLANGGKYEEAIKCYDKVLEFDPKRASLLKIKGDALYRLAKYEEAIKCYDKVLEVDPENSYQANVDALCGKGDALNDLGRCQEAIICFDKALEIDPQYGYPLGSKGISFAYLGKINEAISCCDTILKENPNDAILLYQKACVMSILNHTDEALELIASAIQKDPFLKPKIQNDKDLENVRKDDRFQKLVQK